MPLERKNNFWGEKLWILFQKVEPSTYGEVGTRDSQQIEYKEKCHSKHQKNRITSRKGREQS